MGSSTGSRQLETGGWPSGRPDSHDIETWSRKLGTWTVPPPTPARFLTHSFERRIIGAADCRPTAPTRSPASSGSETSTGAPASVSLRAQRRHSGLRYTFFPQAHFPVCSQESRSSLESKPEIPTSPSLLTTGTPTAAHKTRSASAVGLLKGETAMLGISLTWNVIFHSGTAPSNASGLNFALPGRGCTATQPFTAFQAAAMSALSSC